jgi:hypothetical protein
MKDIEITDIKEITNGVIEKTDRVLYWINQSKEEAREYLLNEINKNKNLTSQEKASLIYNSRKFTREYANSKTIYEQAKNHFNGHICEEDSVDDDWLHFFFDKAEKVSNKCMQVIWARLLAGEFNQPGSISRKLMHIISIMDVNSAKSFQTFCLYVFERYGLFTSYNTEAALIPSGFYMNSFDFMLKVEAWLSSSGYPNCRDLALELTMNTGELNNLENLGLIQMVPDSNCGIPLIYTLDDGTTVCVKPLEDESLPLGQYSLTHERKQLYKILNRRGNKAVLTIVEKYLLSLCKKFSLEQKSQLD